MLHENPFPMDQRVSVWRRIIYSHHEPRLWGIAQHRLQFWVSRLLEEKNLSPPSIH